MAERLVQNIASDYLTCSICWNVFTDPKMLSCGHSFCSKCLYDYIKSVSKSKARDGFDCPICRFTYQIDSNPEDVVNSFSPDVTSIKILQAIGLDGTRLKTVAEKTRSLDKAVEPLEEGKYYRTCKTHPGKRLEVYCSNHDVVVCPECAWRDHRGSDCECSSAQEVILKRLKALKCLASQQNEDAEKLLNSHDSDTRSVPNAQDAFLDLVNNIEADFKVVINTFTDRMGKLRGKVGSVLDKHPAVVELRELRENLEEKLNCFEDEQIGNTEMNPNMSLRSLSELCEISSEYQRSIIELTEKLEKHEVMKCLQRDFSALEAFVTSTKTNVPKELLSAEESLNQDEEFVLVSKTGDCKDFQQKENISDLKYQQFVFSAKLAEEKQCMLSSVALIGTTAVVIVDQMNKKIKKFKIPEGRYLDSVKPPAEPHQLAVLKESSDIIVTLWEEHSLIQMSTDPTLVILRIIDTKAEYTGITSHIPEHIAVSSIRSKRVDVFHIADIDRDDEETCSLDNASKTIYRSHGKRCFPDRIASTSGGSIIVRNRRRNEVSCFTHSGTQLWSRRLLSSAADVTSIRGRVFATLQSKNAIVSFLEDGQGSLQYLEPERAFNKPWSVDGFKDCLVVTEDNSSEWNRPRLFIVHAANDLPSIKPHIIDVLEKEYEIPCLIAERDFPLGKPTITNVIDAIKTCFKTVVVITERSIKSSWVKYETLLALERSQRLNFLSLVVLLFNVDVEPKDVLFGALNSAMVIRVDPNWENWKETMIQEIFRQVPLNKTIVMTNLATGQAWSHFTGYCNVVYPHLRKQITESKWYLENPGRFPVIEFNLIPYSARTCGKLQELDTTHRIQYVGNLDPIISQRGSYPTRPYHVSVYKIKDPVLEQDIYFVCQIPNSLSILNKAEQGCMVLIDQMFGEYEESTPVMKISTGERSLQAARFFYILNRLLNHPKNKSCHGLARLLLYDDTKESATDVLLKALREELAKRTPKSHPLMQQLRELKKQQPASSSSSSEEENPDKNRTVFIACDENVTDFAFKEDLKTILIKNNFKVWDDDLLGQSFAEILRRASNECRWTLFLLSKETLRSDNFELMSFNCRTILHKSIESNERSVVPILDGIKEDELIYELGWVTYLERQDPNFKERLLQTLSFENLSMESTVPATDVHQGLAWAYVLNYLSVVLDDHLKKMETIQRESPGLHVYKKLFIMVPGSCFMKSLDKDELGGIRDPRFQSEKEEKFISKDVSGVVNRLYQLHLFRLQAPTKEYIVAVEFPNSVLCLHEMASQDYLSGLSREKLFHEAWAFCELSKQILSVSKFRDKARLVYFDDDQLSVADTLLQAMEYDENLLI